MSQEKCETESYCAGGFHYSNKVNIETAITKTSRSLPVRKGIKCNRKYSMGVIDKTFKAERLDLLFENIARASAEAV